MADEPQTAEEMAAALITGLLRKGVIDETDIEEMCEGLGEEAAHQLRCCIVEASAPKESDWLASRARERFRVINGGEE